MDTIVEWVVRPLEDGDTIQSESIRSISLEDNLLGILNIFKFGYKFLLFDGQLIHVILLILDHEIVAESILKFFLNLNCFT